MAYDKDIIDLWIRRAEGKAGTNVDPSVCAEIAQAMIAYNALYEQFLGAKVEPGTVLNLKHIPQSVSKDSRFFLSEEPLFDFNKPTSDLKYSFGSEKKDPKVFNDSEIKDRKIFNANEKITELKIIIIILGISNTILLLHTIFSNII